MNNEIIKIIRGFLKSNSGDLSIVNNKDCGSMVYGCPSSGYYAVVSRGDLNFQGRVLVRLFVEGSLVKGVTVNVPLTDTVVHNGVKVLFNVKTGLYYCNLFDESLMNAKSLKGIKSKITKYVDK